MKKSKLFVLLLFLLLSANFTLIAEGNLSDAEREEIYRRAFQEGFDSGFSKGLDRGVENLVKETEEGKKGSVDLNYSSEDSKVVVKVEGEESEKIGDKPSVVEKKVVESPIDGDREGKKERGALDKTHEEIDKDYNLSYEYPSSFVSRYREKTEKFVFGVNFRFNRNLGYRDYYYYEEAWVYVPDYLKGINSYDKLSFSGFFGYEYKRASVNVEVGSSVDRKYVPLGLGFFYSYDFREMLSGDVRSSSDVVSSFRVKKDPYFSFIVGLGSLTYVPVNKARDDTRTVTMILVDLGVAVTFPKAGDLSIFFNLSQGWSHVFTDDNFKREFYNIGLNCGVRFAI